jgi:hypothetical protein
MNEGDRPRQIVQHEMTDWERCGSPFDDDIVGRDTSMNRTENPCANRTGGVALLRPRKANAHFLHQQCQGKLLGERLSQSWLVELRQDHGGRPCKYPE